MLSKTLLSAALFGAAIAVPNAEAQPVYEVIQIRQVISSAVASVASAATDIAALTACVPPTSIMALLTSAPTPPADLASALLTQSDFCKVSFTGSLESEYKSYTSQYSSWAKSNSAALASFQSSYAKNCPLATSLGASANIPVCSNGASSGSSGGSSSGGSSGNSGGSSSNAAVAPQQTFVAVAAGAVAGAVGLLAML